MTVHVTRSPSCNFSKSMPFVLGVTEYRRPSTARTFTCSYSEMSAITTVWTCSTASAMERARWVQGALSIGAL